jgi:pyrrolidone-carboxylate peptidase
MKKDLKKTEMSLEKILKNIKEIEDPDNEAHKFIDTAVYHSFVYNYNTQKKPTDPPYNS